MNEPERLVQSKLIKGLERHGFWVQKVVGQSRNGLPDVVAVGHGMTIWIEVKRDKGRLSSRQISEINDMINHGAQVNVVYGLDDVDSFLRRLDASIAVKEDNNNGPDN